MILEAAQRQRGGTFSQVSGVARRGGRAELSRVPPCKRDSLVPIGEAFSGPDGPVKALRETSATAPSKTSAARFSGSYRRSMPLSRLTNRPCMRGFSLFDTCQNKRNAGIKSIKRPHKNAREAFFEKPKRLGKTMTPNGKNRTMWTGGNLDIMRGYEFRHG